MPTDLESVFSQNAQSEMKPSFDAGQLKSAPVLSFGEKLVGLNFNPSNDDKVSQAKRLCASLMDLVEQETKKHHHLVTSYTNIPLGKY